VEADPVDAYLDRVMAAARLAGVDAPVVRAELRDHLRDLLEDHPSIQPSEVAAMIEREFGDPEEVGKSIGRSKGRVRTILKARGRRWGVRLAVAGVVLFSLRWAVAEVFYIPSTSLAPILPQGSRCLVYKLATHYQPGDVVVYRDGTHQFVGSVVTVDPVAGTLRVHRNTGPEVTVPLGDVTGRVVLNTR
jgi:hypothetical protein